LLKFSFLFQAQTAYSANPASQAFVLVDASAALPPDGSRFILCSWWGGGTEINIKAFFSPEIQNLGFCFDMLWFFFLKKYLFN
jgi:hypothetical protein